MKRSRIFADFHNADKEGRLRLNCAGTMDDLARHGVQLEEGLRIIIYSEELEVEGEVQFSEDESVWVARIDWDAIKDVYSNASDSGARPEGRMPSVTIALPTNLIATQSDLNSSSKE